MKTITTVALVAGTLINSIAAWAEPTSKDDFLLGMVNVAEDTQVTQITLPPCNQSANESVSAIRFLVKRYDLEVDGVAFIFDSAPEILISKINNFAELKKYKDSMQRNDWELYLAPNLDEVIGNQNGLHLQTDAKSRIIDVDAQSGGAKCVRKILIKADTDSVGGHDEWSKKGQLLIFGAKQAGQLND